MSHVLTEVGYAVYLEGDLPHARSLLEEALAIRRELEDRRGIAWALTHLAEVADAQRDPPAASAYLEEAMAVWHPLGFQYAIAWSLHKQGRITQHRGDLGAAQTCFAESLSMWQELENKHGITECLEGLAAAAAEEGGYHHPLRGHPPSPWVPGAARACRLFGAAEALREAGGWPLAPVHRAEYERHVAAVRDTLGETAFAVAWAQGRALPLERALALAREERWARK
jgi:tetratricopeptide (TPR) repeat protein